ncbi:MAG: VWA domain-containing protein [Pirellulales bacterium]|nr:VWA domain-containing protein [Pirellulales bacterium]
MSRVHDKPSGFHAKPDGASDFAVSSPSSAGSNPRSIGADMAGWFTSFGFHLLLLILLAVVSFLLPVHRDDLDLSYQLAEILEEEDPLPEEFLSAEDPLEAIGALSQDGVDSARAASLVVADTSLVVFEPEAITDFGERLVIDADAVFEGPELSEELPVQGAGSVGTTGAVGAIDRITHEIMTSVEQQPTLVVWLFDQSGSLRKERERILARFYNIYEELGVIEASKNPAFKRTKDKPLLTAVVGFGASPHMLTAEPTDEIKDIIAAVRSIQDDELGQENVFQAVAMTAEKFRAYRSSRNGGRNVMIIVFTDESGDDVDQLDGTVNLCRKLAMSVYVVGRPAPFGRQQAYVKWIDPDPNFDQRPQWVPVNLGPESLMPERLKLGFTGSGDRDELLDSGFGPFGLTRLCYETGGLYFTAHPNRSVGRTVSRRETSDLASHISTFFDPLVMRKYQPDYVPAQDYFRRLQSNRAQGALIAAAELSWTSPIEDIRTRFPKRDEASLANLLSVAQRAAAIRQPRIDRICQTLLEGEGDRQDLQSLRWRASYDLALGRALASKVRTDGYNAMLAKAKQGMKFSGEKQNTWIVVADSEYANTSLERLADKALVYLQRVRDEHPDTPWALLASREMKSPLGWRWKEGYTYIPPPRDGANNNPPPRPNREMPRRPSGPPRRNPPPL